MSVEISMSRYKHFDELNNGIFEAAKNIPEGFCDISANVYVTYPCEDEEYDCCVRNLISINSSTIDEAMYEQQKLSAGNYTRITLDVTLERSYSFRSIRFYSDGFQRIFADKNGELRVKVLHLKILSKIKLWIYSLMWI